jgi:hypothetical protein
MSENVYNKTRKPFSIHGEATDQEAIIRLRPQIEDMIEEQMREKGYVPSLDITPELYWEYINEEGKERFVYAVIMYGVFVGKKKSKEILGLLGPHPIYKEPYDGN